MVSYSFFHSLSMDCIHLDSRVNDTLSILKILLQAAIIDMKCYTLCALLKFNMTDIDVQRFGKWGKAEGEASECVIMR